MSLNPALAFGLIAFVYFQLTPALSARKFYETYKPRLWCWLRLPGWLFGVVWPVMYALISASGYFCFSALSPDIAEYEWLFWLFVSNVALNKLWSVVFFDLKLIGAGIVLILGMLGTGGAYMGLLGEKDWLAFWLFLPYVTWLLVALALNVNIYHLMQADTEKEVLPTTQPLLKFPSAASRRASRRGAGVVMKF